MRAHADRRLIRRHSGASPGRARWLAGSVAAVSAMAVWGVGPAADAGVGVAVSAEPEADPTRPLVISEFRVRGPNGANDEFIEITNVSAADHVVAATSGSGYGVAASNGVTRCTIPNGTLIPAFASYLCVNSVGYSLASYPAGNGTTATGDATYTADIPDNAGIALFDNNSGGGAYSLANRLDAVGSTSEANAVYKEGTGYPALTPFSIDYSFYRNLSTASITSTTLDTDTPGVPKDTDNNAADFVFVDTNGTSAGAGQRLGAPGPSNLSSPRTNGNLEVSLLDPCVDAVSPPNAVRDFTSDPGNNSTFGTIDLRRTITNNTGGSVTRLRLRIADVRTFPAPSGIADMRPRTSTAVVTTVDRAPCGSGTSNVTVQGTTLEQPPSQPNGGGFNSSMSVGVVTLATPLAPGDSINVRLLTGLQQTGAGGVRVIAEALTTGGDNTPHTGECLNTPEGDLCGLSNGSDITIPTSGAATPYPSVINAVFPAGTTVTDVNVGIHGFSHTFPSDVDILLVAPDGTTNSILLSDTGGSADVLGVNLTFDDEAGGPVPSPITSGTYRPTEAAGSTDSFPPPAPAPAATTALSNFDGSVASGAWSLYVLDDAGGDSGVISGWSLDLKTAPGCESKPASIVGTSGPDVILGTAGNDVIVGLGGDDEISGLDGNDRICGGSGADEIRDQGGADRVFGEVGDDDFVMTATADQADVVHGGDGTDHASYRGRTADVSLTINAASDDGAAGEHDRLLAVEDLTGGDGNDFISGSGGANELIGRGGNDTLRDLTGPDRVFGGEGDDTLLAPGTPDASDVYNGGLGTDHASYAARSTGVDLSLDGVADDGGGGAETDNLVGIENATGGTDDDTISGSPAVNTLSGGGGSDIIDDLAGGDTVVGGPGDDVFNQPGAVDPGDTFNGGGGVDEVSYAQRSTQVAVSLAGGANDGATGENDAVNGVENASGGLGDDTLAGTGIANLLKGNGGNDTIRDLGGADTAQGGAGDDRFVQGSAPDAGDVFSGGIGTDAIFYADRGGAVALTLGNATNDDGAAGENDGLFTVENAFGGDGNDTITGSGVDNFLRGGLGDDDLKGLAGDDDLFGDGGADDLHTLDGVGGNDVANGGTGSDTATTDPGDTRLSIP